MKRAGVVGSITSMRSSRSSRTASSSRPRPRAEQVAAPHRHGRVLAVGGRDVRAPRRPRAAPTRPAAAASARLRGQRGGHRHEQEQHRDEDQEAAREHVLSIVAKKCLDGVKTLGPRADISLARTRRCQEQNACKGVTQNHGAPGWSQPGCHPRGGRDRRTWRCSSQAPTFPSGGFTTCSTSSASALRVRRASR